MDYLFFDENKLAENCPLPVSDKINPFLLKHTNNDVLKALDFMKTNDVFMYVHGFLGTGKRQFINYITEFLKSDVIKLEYYCKPSTVCDDILLKFLDILNNDPIANVIETTAKLTTMRVKFLQYTMAVKKPILIILHSYDDILEENAKLVFNVINEVIKNNSNVKIVISTRAMVPNILGEIKINKKIYLKPFTKEIFKEFVEDNGIECTEKTLEDFYSYTRGYYYYTALTLKIILSMHISINEFLQKFAASGADFDTYLGLTYINLIPTSIRNFFWFLRTLRHGVTINALASLELYDDFSVNYLVKNLMAFISDETIYVQDYFQQNIDISIPEKVEVKLHKYIINIYEKELKKSLQQRDIFISRQALRSEIDYHNNCITNIKNRKNEAYAAEITKDKSNNAQNAEKIEEKTEEGINIRILAAKKLAEENKNTEAIEAYLKIIDEMQVDLITLTEIRTNLARLYKIIGDSHKAEHYYELAEAYYKHNKEVINLHYLYYEMAELYSSIYKNNRAIELLKQVIYSVDSPQSLMVSACTLIGNIYSDINNPDEAYDYYKKALDSLDDNTETSTLAELYFKYALACDDREDMETAFEYYNKCLSVENNNLYSAPAYSNLGVAYYDNDNYSDSKDCFIRAYNIEKSNNNYDGIYFTSLYIAKICVKENDNEALKYLLEAKQSAEFLNETFYMLESSLALGDYYYNNKAMISSALKEYFLARKYAEFLGNTVDTVKIADRIYDMKLRMEPLEFQEIEEKYGK